MRRATSRRRWRGRLGALLPLPLSVATRALRRVGVLELRTEDLDKLAKEGALCLRTSPPPAMASGEMQRHRTSSLWKRWATEGAMANGELDVCEGVEVPGFQGKQDVKAVIMTVKNLTILSLVMNLIALFYSCQIVPVLKALSLVVVLMAASIPMDMNIAATATWVLGSKELTIKDIAGMAILSALSIVFLWRRRLVDY